MDYKLVIGLIVAIIVVILVVVQLQRVIHAVAQKCRAMTVEMVAANVSSGRR